MEDWKELFIPQILKRGHDLYTYGSVGEINEENNTYSTTVEGTNGYVTKVSLLNGKVDDPSCTCSYSQNALYCKHLAALLYKMEDKYGKALFLEDDNPEKAVLLTALKARKSSSPLSWQKLLFQDDDLLHYLSFGSSLDIYKPRVETAVDAEALVINNSLGKRTIEISGEGRERNLVYTNVIYSEDHENAVVKIVLGKNGIKEIKCREGYYSAYHSIYYTENKLLTKNCGIDTKNKDGVIELCVHKTAALIDLMRYLKENRDILDYSSSSAEKLINSFKKDILKKEEPTSDEVLLVDIEPTINASKLELRITNSEGKYYKVKDTEKLYSSYLAGSLYSPGRNTIIDFSNVQLTKRAERVMELLKSLKVADIISHQEDRYRDTSFIPYTEILDDFYSIMKESVVIYSSSPLLGFREREPSFNMKIEELRDNGNLVGITVNGNITGKYKSNKYLYWIQDGYLNRTPLSKLGSASSLSEIAKDDGSFSFDVGMNLIDNFYQRVLPNLRRYGKIEDTAAEKIEALIEEAPISVFYVDMEKIEKKDVIICHPTLRYNKREVDIFPDKDERKASTLKKNEKWNAFENDVRDILNAVFDGPITTNREWSLKNNDDSIYHFLSTGLATLMENGEVHATDPVRRLVLKKLPHVKGKIDIDKNNDSVLNFSLDLQGLTIDELVDVLKSYRDKRKYHRLKNGDFVSLGGTNLDSLASLFIDSGLPVKDFIKGNMHIPLYRALYLDGILNEQNGIQYEGGQRFRRLLKEFKTINASDYDVPSSLDNTMRTYQKDGYRWMRVLFAHGFGGILADDMGLGKTVQALALLLALKEEGKNMNSLIVTPASLVYNWKAETTKFTPSLNCVTVTGSAKERERIIKNHRSYDILITSYDLLKKDITLYEGETFDIEILDEAQFIKNSKTASSKAVRAVSASHRLALTGTPIENRLSELWSIFEYLMPGFLFNEETFAHTIAIPIEKYGDRNAQIRLKKLTSPFILRRLKSDVLKELPEKIEETRVVPLSGEQLKVYTAAVANAKGMLKGSENYNKKKIEILAELTRIREICCDPRLVYKDYDGASAKREAVIDLIVSAIDGGHKILLFSQFTSMLELLEKDLNKLGIEYYLITGETGKAKRLENVDAFNSGNVPLFLISLKAGGTGLNLTSADIVIHYDPWWNTAVQNQATDRAHRIGQTKRVTVFKIICENTIEEKILRLQETKKNLANEIVSSDNISLSTLSKEDLMELLDISKIR